MSRPRVRILAAGLAVGAGLAWIARRPLARMQESFARSSMPSSWSYDLAAHIAEPMYARIAANAAQALAAGGTVLDAGCGPGQLALQLARHAGIAVTGLDLDAGMLARAEANAARAAGPDARRPTFVLGAVESLPFPDASFDLVVSSFSLHHWTDPRAGLREIARVLKPGGRAMIWDISNPIRWLERRGAMPLDLVSPGMFADARRTGRWAVGPFGLAERYEFVAPLAWPAGAAASP